ncbi:MAG: HAD family hydrolase [Desulfovibrio sp.]|nr:HAD family hydrolase [Desulfovibrio sp.]
MSLRCLVFDCDGVLLDSVPAKTQAFARLARPYGPKAEERFVAFHQSHGGVSRYEKFAWFFREILGREITPQESQDFGNQFKTFCREELANCREINGAREVLSFWHGRLPLYVCSGAPEAEQREVLTEHDLARYFDGIFGSPPEKAALLQKIVAQAQVAPKQTLMVGDATTDLEAAQHAGTLFYGVGSLLRGGDYPWSMDLTELSAYLSRLQAA